MTLYKQSEGSGARRKYTFVCVDDTDGKTPETGLTFSDAEVSVRKAGGSYAAVSGIGAIAEVGGGEYEGEFTAGELDTFGPVHLKIAKTGVRTTIMNVGQVVAVDPYAVEPARSSPYVVTILVGDPGTAGVSSHEKLTGDGYVEYVTDAVSINSVGLSTTNADESVATIGWSIPHNGTHVSVWEDGEEKFAESDFLEPGDVLRIRRSGQTISYEHQRGEAVTTIYTSLATTTAPLVLDTAHYSGAGVTGLRMVSGGYELALTLAAVNCTVIGMGIRATTGGGAVRDAHVKGIDADTVGEISAEVDALLTDEHGEGSWQEGGGASAADVADAVWDEQRAAHNEAGSFGAGVRLMDAAITAAKFAADAITSAVLASSAAQKIRDSILDYAHDTGVTIRGLFVRIESFIAGRSTGQKGPHAKWYKRGGTTDDDVAFEGDVDPANGARGESDVSGSEP